MAEAIAKRHLPPKTQVCSRGLRPGKVEAKAVEVLREIGIDVSTQELKALDTIPTGDIDLTITLGDPSETHTIVFPGAKLRTWNISDPRRDPGASLETFRKVRDEIDNKIAALFLDYWRNMTRPDSGLIARRQEPLREILGSYP